MILAADRGLFLCIVPPVGVMTLLMFCFLRGVNGCLHVAWVSFVWSERLGQHDCWVTKPSCFLLGRERDREISRYQHNKSFKKCFPGKASVMNGCKTVTTFHFNFCYIHSFLQPHAFSWKLLCSNAAVFYGTCERRRQRTRDCRTAEWTFIIMSLFLSRQECWARSRIIRLVLFHLLAFSVSHSSDDLVRIKYGEKDNCADGLNICLSSHHNHYTTKSHFAQLELSKLFPVALVRDKTMFRVHNRK